MGEKVGPERMEWLADDLRQRLEHVEPSGKVTLRCQNTECDGTYQPTGWQWPVYPPGYHHRCNVCGDGVVPTGGIVYPREAA